MIETIVTVLKWAVIIAAVVGMVAALVTFFGTTADLGTASMTAVMEAQQVNATSPSYKVSFLLHAMHRFFGDEWEPLSWGGAWTAIMAAAGALGALYLAWFGYRLLRVIVS